MRKVLLFVVASATTVGGLYLVGTELLFADRIYFRFVIGGTVLTTIGAYLLWVDFAAPLIRIKTWEDR